MRQHHYAGEKLFVGYAGHTIGIVDARTGKISEAQVFVVVWSVENYTFAEASQSLPDWIGSHVRGVEFFKEPIKCWFSTIFVAVPTTTNLLALVSNSFSEVMSEIGALSDDKTVKAMHLDASLTEPCSKHWTLAHNLAVPERASASSVPDGSTR